MIEKLCRLSHPHRDPRGSLALQSQAELEAGMVPHWWLKIAALQMMPLRRGVKCYSGKLRFVHAPYTLRPRVYIAETVDFS